MQGSVQDAMLGLLAKDLPNPPPGLITKYLLARYKKAVNKNTIAPELVGMRKGACR